MPGLAPSELAQQIDVDRLEGLTGEHDSRLTRDETLIRQLQGSVKAAQELLALLNAIPITGALPANPVDGQYAIYRTTGTAQDWLFRYTPAYTDGYPWVFLGGAQLYAAADANVNTTSTTYVAPSGPMSLVLPLKGIWDVTVASSVWHGAASLSSSYASYTVGATAASDTWACAVGVSTTAGKVHAVHRHTIAAPATLAERIRTAATATANFSARRMVAIPVRVG